MKQPQISEKNRNNPILLAFLLPTAVMLAIYFITSITPFGSQTLLYSDNFHQYYPFFRQFRQALRSGESLLWTWSVGMGMDYLGLISYYLASPLNLLSVILPESWVLPYFTLLMPMKLGLASGFFALLLKKLYGKEDMALPLFGAFYAMCAWALGYQWNIMWLDGFALLPLVALGTILLLRDGKYLLYTLSLTVAVAANYYVGFFVCIFVFLLFWCYEICRFRGLLRLLGDLCLIGFFTVLAIGMTAIVELPTLAALQDTYSSVNQFPTGFEVNIVSGEAVTKARELWHLYKTDKIAGHATFASWFAAVKASIPPLLDGMRQIAGQVGGGQTPTYMEGLPNLYCGVFPIALGWLFLMSKDVRLRDKFCAVALLVLFMCSFLFRQLDYIWHGFHFTNQIPYRFSFLFSFVVLYMAWRAWLLRESFPLWKILLAGVLSVVVLLFGGHQGSDYLYWLFNLAFLGLYLVCMVAQHSHFDLLGQALAARGQEELPQAQGYMLHREETQRRRQRVRKAVAATMALELVLHTALFFSGFSIYDYDYPKKEDAAAAVFQKIEEMGSDQLFYRTEVTHAQTLNDGALNGYHGISTFTSSANVATTEFMQSLGAAARNNWNRYCYEMSSPVSNLFLNLRYLVERDEKAYEDSCYRIVLEENGLTVLENRTYLPLGFLAEPALAEMNFNPDNRSFSFQNRLFRAATGLQGSVWHSVPAMDLTVSTTGDVATIKENVSGWTSFSTGADGGTMIYTYQISQEGYLCLDVNLSKHKNFSVWHNGARLYSESFSLPQLLAVGDVRPGDEVQIRVTCAPNMASTSMTVSAAILDQALFMEGYEVLAASTLELTEFSTIRVAGTVNCDQDGLLYTSVPQDGNWVAYVDGEKAEISLVGGCMVGIPLTHGQHTVQLRYENEAFRIGAWITAGCATAFGLFVLLEILIARKKKKA